MPFYWACSCDRIVTEQYQIKQRGRGGSSSTAGSEHMLNYGNEGIETSEMVKRLVKVSRQIHKHLLE
jgi:hypothetical protein